MNITLNMNHGRVKIFQIHDRINIILYPATIKNDNGAVAMIFSCATRAEQKTTQIKKDKIVE